MKKSILSVISLLTFAFSPATAQTAIAPPSYEELARIERLRHNAEIERQARAQTELMVQQLSRQQQAEQERLRREQVQREAGARLSAQINMQQKAQEKATQKTSEKEKEAEKVAEAKSFLEAQAKGPEALIEWYRTHKR